MWVLVVGLLTDIFVSLVTPLALMCGHYASTQTEDFQRQPFPNMYYLIRTVYIGY